MVNRYIPTSCGVLVIPDNPQVRDSDREDSQVNIRPEYKSNTKYHATWAFLLARLI